MEQYINKAALVAEIEKKKKLLPWGSCASQISMECNCKNEAYDDVISFLNSIEVEEADFEKELDEWLKYGHHTDYPWCSVPDAIEITAEHFFELGLKAQKGE